MAGSAETDRDLKGRVTMLCDQTTRSESAGRQPNGRDRDSLISCRWRPRNAVLIAATAVVRLIAKSIAATGMGDSAITAVSLRAAHLDQ